MPASFVPTAENRKFSTKNLFLHKIALPPGTSPVVVIEWTCFGRGEIAKKRSVAKQIIG
jgi:hypothetical protein